VAGPRLDPAVMRETLDLVKRHGGVAQASRASNVPYSTFETRYRRAKAADQAGDLVGVESLEDRQAIPVGLPFEREWKAWMAHIGMAKDRYAGPAKPRARTGRLRVVAAGDFHIPFHDRDALAMLCVREKDADVLVIGGDFGDAHCASTFTKYEHVSYEAEHAGKVAVLQTLSETFPLVKYLKGSNHTDRFEKRLREHLDKDMLDAIMSMTGGILNPDLALVKRYPNIEVSGWTTPRGQGVSWLTMVGDVVFSHAEKYSVTPGFALRKVEEWLDDQTGHLGLPEMRCLVQFHTHAVGWFPWRSDKLLVEPGCMCQVHSYQLGARIAGRPQRLGYVVMEIVDGKVDLGSVQIRWLDAEKAA
jgi:hypothetical protein